MIILGIDPGLAQTGYAILKVNDKKIKSISFGCLKTSAKLSLEKRINKIYDHLKKIIKKYKPNKIAVEQLFFCKNVKTALKVGQARGIIYLIASQAKIPISEFTPLQVKQTLTGYGRAEKSQIQKMLKILFNLKNIPQPDDAADALAIAYCCFQTKEFN